MSTKAERDIGGVDRVGGHDGAIGDEEIVGHGCARILASFPPYANARARRRYDTIWAGPKPIRPSRARLRAAVSAAAAGAPPLT